MSETNRLGDIGELVVAARLAELGYRVSIPFGHDSPYDLVVEVDGHLKKVQVKSITPKNGCLPVKCTRVTNITKGKQIRQSYTKNDFDYMIAYDAKSSQCYNVPIDLVHETEDTLYLRIDPTKNGQATNIRWARDYLLEGL